MGSFPRQRVGDEELCRFYVDEQKTLAWIGLKTRLSSAQVRTVLIENGVRLRTTPEVRRLAIRLRQNTRRSSDRPMPTDTRPVFKGDA